MNADFWNQNNFRNDFNNQLAFQIFLHSDFIHINLFDEYDDNDDDDQVVVCFGV